MTGLGWWLTGFISHLLGPSEREAVQGDLVEAGDTGWQGFLAVLGLLTRRQAVLWNNWRPWLAAFGLAVPSSFLLMGFSISVSHAYQQWMESSFLKVTGQPVGPGFSLLLCNVVLLIGWGWAGGFVAGSVSRRTLWVTATLSLAPCLFCLERFRVESLSRLCLFLFLPPAIWGVRRGLQITHIRLTSAIALAVALTLLTVPTWSRRGAWIPNWALSWPAWYLVATAKKPTWLLRRQGYVD